MKKFLTKKRDGFTIIEILIVLAIAGLILAIVFVAVPQVTRNTRDTKRQNIAARLSTELQTYASNNQGKYPFTDAGNSFPGTDCSTANVSAFSCNSWYGNYISGGKVDTRDPKTGADASIHTTTASGNLTLAPWAPDTVIIGAGLSCSGSSFSGTGATTALTYAVAISLERSGTWYCVDNG